MAISRRALLRRELVGEPAPALSRRRRERLGAAELPTGDDLAVVAERDESPLRHAVVDGRVLSDANG